jgi:hypothetical protein
MTHPILFQKLTSALQRPDYGIIIKKEEGKEYGFDGSDQRETKYQEIQARSRS